MWRQDVFTVATTSYGVCFIFALNQGKEKEVWLKDFNYAVFGLGNRQYEHFNKVCFIEYVLLLS